MTVTNNGNYELYQYEPSLIAAVVACAIFGLLTTGHTFRLVQSKAYFNVPFLIGGIFETVGYGARCISHSNNQAVLPYAMQSLLILLAPALFAATIYMTLGRVMIATNSRHYSSVPFKWLTKIFVLGDVTSFLTQCAGGGILASDNGKHQDLGENIILAGLCIQIVWFGCFIFTAARFQLRMHNLPTVESSSTPWRSMLWVLQIISFIILGRSIYRVTEYAMGHDGYLLQHEWSLYVFDMAQMALCMLLWLIWHPIMIQPALIGATSVKGTGTPSSMSENLDHETKSPVHV